MTQNPLALKTMMGRLNPNMGQKWTNPNVGLKMQFPILTQLQLSLSIVLFFLKLHFNPTFGFVHI